MKGLWIKDLEWIVCQKNTMILFLVLGLFYLVMGMGEFAVVFLSILLSILFTKSILFDESNNGMLYLFSMPCTKKQYVIEKYLFSILTSFGIAVLMCLSIIFFSGWSFNESFMLMMTCFCEIALLVSLTIPLILKYGQSGQIVLSLIVFIPVVLLVVFEEEISSMDLTWLEQAFTTLQTGWMTALALLVVLVIMLISIWLSVKILNKKEY